MTFLYLLVFQSKLLENQEILIREQREIKALLLRVVSNFNPNPPEAEPEIISLLPLSDEESLEKLEAWLQTAKNYKELVRIYIPN